jgi:hypothetical protein
MRPRTLKSDLPSAYDVKMSLNNEFVDYLNKLKVKITVKNFSQVSMIWKKLTNAQNLPGKVSLTVDGWTADTTKEGFLGITGHWIDVTEKGEWELESKILALRGLSGDHGGKNLGRYVVGLCDRVGVIGNKESKVIRLIIDNRLVSPRSAVWNYAR